MRTTKPSPATASKVWRMIVGLTLCVAMFGCTQVPLDQPKPITTARESAESAKLNIAISAASQNKSTAQSSFAVLNDGNEALGARLRLIEAAEDTVDLQYFLMKSDLAAALIGQALLRAADRGVRVRLLLDDVFTTASDKGLGLINSHPNIDIRIFNPATRPGPKFASFLTDFSRINRRMHNKLFTADGAFAVIGGRNIADEYFQIGTTSEFADLDMLVTGPVVASISDAFDTYWNDGWSIPIERLRKAPTQEQLIQARADMNARMIQGNATYEKAVKDPYFERLIAGKEPVYHGYASVITDAPAKLKVPVRDGERKLAETLLGRMKNANDEVLLLTPYFVPEDYGARLFSDLAARGVKVRIVTNSLGSTNHAYVHAGYRRHRPSLLDAGVELYEVRSDALQALALVPPGDKTDLVMHTKLAVIDGQDVFVGSLNLDPRSIKQNTEFGVFIKSPPLAGEIGTRLQNDIAKYTYRLTKSADGALQWHYDNPSAPVTTTKEPGATLWTNLVVGFTELLGVELQL